MSQGRSIRLFLVDGTPHGLLTAEIMNWTGHVLSGQRTKLSELVKRPECGRTGVYFLVGPDPDNGLRPLVYIGESDDVGMRLKQHNRPEEKGGKDFWEKACLVTSKDPNLTKAHVKYLESLLIQSAGEVGRCKLVNGTAHEYINLPESDRADMAFFLEQIRTILPVLGFDFLSEQRKTPSNEGPGEGGPESSPVFVMEIASHGVKARAQEVDGQFFVLSGSIAREKWVSEHTSYRALYEQLKADGVLKVDESGKTRFSAEQAFSSPSAAAAIVSGRPANGRTSWCVEGSGQTYAAWQDQQVSAAAGEG
ncbi:GIY-YIG nuclease family protein [Thioalkalivibrio versutus]|uniref:GIY-YIG nuclease family protein n=1 Tax=Thioalkalivibrio versutus TaxID=106634 RepID=UPI00037F744B|nr:GIY-YIG nuclease family protein [Thioalkalivibrio versutus]OOC50681.1 endonuclease [Thioalkalivibrio versutus]